MKTVRTNCFETNSSSTHSFTIISKRDLTAKKPILPLFDSDTNTLHVDRLSQQPCFISMSGDSWVLNAESVHEKAALLIHHVEGRYEKIIPECLVRERVQALCGYSAVLGKASGGFNSYEEDDYLAEIEEEAEDIREAIDEFIRTVVLNSDRVMQESESDY